MGKLTVAILFGGCSEEYRISLKSAHSIISNMDREKYDLVMIGITKQGEWLKYAGPMECLLNDTWNDKRYCTPAIISPDRSTHGLIEIYGARATYYPLDVVFPMLHGKYGEDGTIQGLLELSGIPYVGCGVQSSVLCMDKELAYRVLQGEGIMTPKFRTLYSSMDSEITDQVEGLVYPVFVKPANSGSSFGVTKVIKEEELPAAISEASKYDNKILIEQAIEGTEVGCAVLGCGNRLTVGEVDQIVLSHGFFRIHQEAQPEISSDNSTINVPARVKPEVRQYIQQTAATIYQALGCSGLARVDMFLTSDNQVVFNEVNTMPGFTSYSRYPRMMNAAGIGTAQIVDRVIELAIKSKGKENTI